MDKRAERKLAEITRKTNSHLLRKLIKQERPMDDTRKALEDAATSGKLDLATRRKVQDMLRNKEVQKSLNRVTTSIDQDLSDVMTKRLDAAINRAKKHGLLPEPDMNEYRSYMKKIHHGKV